MTAVSGLFVACEPEEHPSLPIKEEAISRHALAVGILVLSASAAGAQKPSLPATAKQLTGDEIVKFLNGTTRASTVYSAKGEMAAVTTWNWKKKTISGTWNRASDGKSGKFSYVWTIDGDQSCGAPKGKEASCSTLYVDGDTMYDVKAGAVNSVSKPAR